MDETNTLPPGNPATATVVISGQTLHLTFGIPEGQQGQQGPQGEQGIQGPPGEVSTAEMNNAIALGIQGTSNNSNGVNTLFVAADTSYNQMQVQQLADKLDELINALRR